MFKTVFESEKKEWRGSNEESAYRNGTSLPTLILNSLRKHGSRIAQVLSPDFFFLFQFFFFFMFKICASTHRVHTFQDLYGLTICVAKNLQKLNLKRDDLITIITIDDFQAIPIVFAALCRGITVAPIPFNYSRSKLLLTLEQTKPTIIICDSNIYDLIGHLSYNAKIFIFGHRFEETRNVNELFQANNVFNFQ